MKQIIQNRKENYPKTGDWKTKIPVVSDKCVGCEACVKYCPEATMFMGEIKSSSSSPSEKEKPKRRAGIKYDFCKGCGVCAEVCPYGAIEMKDIN